MSVISVISVTAKTLCAKYNVIMGCYVRYLRTEVKGKKEFNELKKKVIL